MPNVFVRSGGIGYDRVINAGYQANYRTASVMVGSEITDGGHLHFGDSGVAVRATDAWWGILLRCLVR